LVVLELHGSHRHIFATVPAAPAPPAALAVLPVFLSPLFPLASPPLPKYFCKKCESEFDGSPKIQIEESPNEPVADGLILKERGQYTCGKCSSIIGEYRVFEKGQ